VAPSTKASVLASATLKQTGKRVASRSPVNEMRLDVVTLDDASSRLTYKRTWRNGSVITAGEIWKRSRFLGRGAFGRVWLETYASGPKKGQHRAVKEIPTTADSQQDIDYNRELETLAKFSASEVQISFRLQG